MMGRIFRVPESVIAVCTSSNKGFGSLSYECVASKHCQGTGCQRMSPHAHKEQCWVHSGNHGCETTGSTNRCDQQTFSLLLFSQLPLENQRTGIMTSTPCVLVLKGLGRTRAPNGACCQGSQKLVSYIEAVIKTFLDHDFVTENAARFTDQIMYRAIAGLADWEAEGWERYVQAMALEASRSHSVGSWARQAMAIIMHKRKK